MSHTDRHDPYGPRTHFKENAPASPITLIIVLALAVLMVFGAMAVLRNADTGSGSPTATSPITQPATPPASVPAPARPTSP